MRATSSATLGGSCHRATDTSITASARRQSAHTAWRAAQSRLSAVVAPIRFGSKRKSWGGCADVAGGDCPTARSGGRDADAGATAPMQSLPLSYPPSPRSVETVNTRHRWAGSDPDAHYTALGRGSQASASTALRRQRDRSAVVTALVTLAREALRHREETLRCASSPLNSVRGRGASHRPALARALPDNPCSWLRVNSFNNSHGIKHPARHLPTYSNSSVANQ